MGLLYGYPVRKKQTPNLEENFKPLGIVQKEKKP
jgi:hypothetical protein